MRRWPCRVAAMSSTTPSGSYSVMSELVAALDDALCCGDTDVVKRGAVDIGVTLETIHHHPVMPTPH